MESLKEIGGIRIFAAIHEGATTLVFKGFQPSLERTVLLKVLRPEFSQDPSIRQRFEEEAKLIARIQHPNVVAIFDYGHEGPYSYFATEYIDGLTLQKLIQQCEALPVEIAWFILLETARGLKAAHDKNILHKDIKPSNILISLEGLVKITDFGMAALRLPSPQEQEISGTLAYMSPEQILGETLDKYSDLFSLGSTFYQMLTGTPAFSGNSTNDYFQAILNEDPVKNLYKRPQVPLELVQICQKMLMKEKKARYQSCAELIADLETFAKKYEIDLNQENLKQFLQEPEKFKTLFIVSSTVQTHDLITQSQNAKIAKKPVLTGIALLLIIVVGFFSYSKIKKDEFSLSTEPKAVTQPLPADSTIKKSELINKNSKPQNRIEPEKTPFSKAPQNKHTEESKIKSAGRTSKTAKEETNITHPTKKSIFPKTQKGYLQISCNPWAVVYLNDDSLGTTPFNQILTVNSGWYELTFRNPEFPEHKTTVVIKTEDTARVNISLWSLVGILKLDVRPWAEVYVDGKFKDQVPPQSGPIILTPGKHQLTLKNPQLGEWSTTIDIKAEQTLQLRFNLTNLLSR